LGCFDRFRAQGFLESYGTSSAWGAREAHENEFVFSARGNGWHVDRRRFDEMLCECASEAGVHVFRKTRFIEAERIALGWLIKVRRGSDVSDLHARFVIDATGRSARFAVEQGAERMLDDRLTGVFATFQFPDGAAAPRDTRTLVEAQEDGWWYSSYVPGPRAVVMWVSDADLIRDRGLARDGARWHEHLASSNLTAARVAAAQQESALTTLSARSQRLVPASGPGWVAAGDAASSFDPLSSQGILKALHSGKIASFVAFDWMHGLERSYERYNAAVTAEYESYRATKASFYAMERRWPESPFWARRQSNPPAPASVETLRTYLLPAIPNESHPVVSDRHADPAGRDRRSETPALDGIASLAAPSAPFVFLPALK
jgi:flavin-dependent dehydrogenase